MRSAATVAPASRERGTKTLHVFVACIFRELANRSGALDGGTPCPQSLLPFVESFDFSRLADALRRHPSLYFHAAVRSQIGHLLRLRDDEDEWERLGWAFDSDERGAAMPAEAHQAKEILQRLLQAHVHAILPDMEIAPRRVRRKPGRQGGLKNPHPTRDPSTAWISSTTLFTTWRALREGFELPHAQTLLRKLPKQPAGDYVTRVVALAHEIITQVYETDDELERWSGLMRWVPIGEPPPDMSDSELEFWRDYQQRREMRTTADLTSIIVVALSPAQRSRLRKAGCAGYLASAVLAAHLGLAEPDRVQNTVENYRRAHSA